MQRIRNGVLSNRPFQRQDRGGAWPLLLTLVVALSACGTDTGNGAPAPEPLLGQGTQVPPRGTAWVIFGNDTVRAEVARTNEQRSRGLMFREELPEGRGMLFIFEEVAPRSFWMRNTYLPLDIAFLDAERRIVDIQAMEPLDENFTDSRAPAMFALEVPQGWFARQGIEVGAVATFVFGAS